MVTLPSPLAGEGSGVRGRCRRRKDWRPSVLFLCKLLCKSLTPPTPSPPTPLPQGERGESTCPARQRLLQQSRSGVRGGPSAEPQAATIPLTAAAAAPDTARRVSI